MEQPRDLPLDVLMGLREEMAETRATVKFITALASLGTALVTAISA